MADYDASGFQPVTAAAPTPATSSFDPSGFTPVSAPPSVMLHEDTGKTVSVPAGVTGDEANYLVHKQVEKQPSDNFWGIINMGTDAVKNLGFEDVKGLGKAALNFTGGLAPRIAGGLSQEFGERNAAAAKGTPNSEGVSHAMPTLMDMFLPQSIDPNSAINQAKQKAYGAVGEAGKSLVEATDNFMQEHGLSDPGPGKPGHVGYEVGNVGAQVAHAIGLSYLTDSPLPAAALFASLQKTDAYREARAKNINPDTAGEYGTNQATATFALQNLGIAVWNQIGKSVASPLGRFALRMADEATQGGSQSAAGDVIGNVSGVRDVGMMEGLKNVAHAAILQVIGGAPVAAIHEFAATKSGPENHIAPEQAAKVVEAVIANSDEAHQAAADTLKAGINRMAADPAAQAKTAKVMKDFVEGRDVETGQPLDEPQLKTANESMRGEAQASAATRPEDVIAGLREDAGQKVDVSPEVTAGRLRLLDRQVAGIDREIDRLSALMDERQGAEKPNAANTARLQKLLAQRDRLDEERASILTTERPNEQQKVDANAASKEVQVKGKVLQDLSKMVTSERVRFLEEGLREGRRLAITNVKKAQTYVTDLLEKSGLAAADKAKFLRTVRGITTPEEATKALPLLQSRVASLLEKQGQRENKDKLVGLLKKTVVKKQSGKPVGKFTPDIQDALDSLRDATKLKAGEAQAELDKRLAATEKDGQTMPPSPVEALQNRVLSIMADNGSVPSEESRQLLEEVKQLVSEGKMGANDRLVQRAERLNTLRMMAQSVVGEGTPRHLIDRTNIDERIGERMREARGKALGYLDNWANTLDVIFGANKEGAGPELVERLGNEVSDRIQQSKGITRQQMDRLEQAGMEAYGFSKPKQLWNRMAEDSKVIDLGHFVDTAGKEVRLQMTRAETRKRWMELQDPSLVERIISPKGNAMSPDMLEAMNSVLTPEDLKFAEAQLELYRDFYHQIDEVYAPTYGVHLPQNENYSPVRSEHANEAQDGFFGADMQQKRSATNGSLKSRTATLNALKATSDFAKFQQHVTEMAHFISMVDKVQEINAVFNDSEVRKDIQAKFGEEVMGNIDAYIQDFARGRPQRLRDGTDIVNKLYSHFASSVLGAKLAMIPKQMTSFMAYAEKVPTADFMAGLADFALNPAKAARVLNQSELVKARGSDLERTIALATKEGKLGQSSKLDNLRHFLRMGEVLGDKLSLLTGGWAVYRYNKEVLGKTHEEALKEFDRATAETQQSGDIDQQSRLQAAGGAAGRVLTMFQSGQNQLYRREVKAIRDAYRGNISKAQAAKAVFIFHVAIPMLYQYVANAFSWDTHDELRAGILGSFNGIFLLNDALDNGLRALMGDKVFEGGAKSPFGFIGDLLHGMKKLTDENADMSELIDGWRAIGAAAGAVVGLPLQRLADAAQGIEELKEGDTHAGAARISGFPNSVADKLVQ